MPVDMRGVRLIVATMGLALVAGCGSGGGDIAGSTTRSVRARTLLSQEERTMRQRFNLFRTLPEPVPAALRGGLSREMAPSWEHGQRLPLFGYKIWAVPGAGRLCLLNLTDPASAAFACKRLRRVLSEGMFLAMVPAGSLGGDPMRTIVGIAPNGTSGVRIHAKGARVRAVGVQENVFALRDEGRAFPESIELIRAR
jgi:hypothetical protein